MGKEGQQVPTMGAEWIATISDRYIELFEKITGQRFVPKTQSIEETEKQVLDALSNILPA